MNEVNIGFLLIVILFCIAIIGGLSLNREYRRLLNVAIKHDIPTDTLKPGWIFASTKETFLITGIVVAIPIVLRHAIKPTWIVTLITIAMMLVLIIYGRFQLKQLEKVVMG